MNFLETEDVVKQYANHLALDKVSIQVPEGKVLRLIRAERSRQNHTDPYHQPHHGPRQRPVRFNGREFQPEDIYQIGYLPEERGLYKKRRSVNKPST